MIAILFLTWGALAAFQVAAWRRITTDRRWQLGAVAGALALSLAHQLMFRTLAEDAFISLRYSMNLAEGNGMVFNAGEKVEGYSNFLWVVLVALPHALFDADIVQTARLLGVLSTLTCVVLVYLLTKRITGDGGAGVLAATITAASSSLAAYGPSGLETPLFALLVVATLLAAYSGRMLVAGVLVALATMTRPDGVVFAVVIGVWLLARAIRGRDSWRSPGMFCAAALALAVPWTAWRLAYYGYLLPNAIAAKSGAGFAWQLEVGWKYFLGFVIAMQALLVLVPAAVFALSSRRAEIEERARSTVWLVLVLTVVYLLFFTATGGDWMPAWRFFAPAMPLFAIFLAAVWSLTGPGRRRTEPHQSAGSDADDTAEEDEHPAPAARGAHLGPAIVAGVSLLLLTVSATAGGMKSAIDKWHAELHEMRELGAWMARTLPDNTVITTYANGGLSYEAGLKVVVVDQLGLTDEHIARAGKRKAPGTGAIGHTAYDLDYVVGVRRPEVVFLTGSGYYPTDTCELRPEFAERYVPATFQVTDRDQRWALVYLRKDRADQLIPMLDADPRFEHVPCPPD